MKKVFAGSVLRTTAPGGQTYRFVSEDPFTYPPAGGTRIHVSTDGFLNTRALKVADLDTRNTAVLPGVLSMGDGGGARADKLRAAGTPVRLWPVAGDGGRLGLSLAECASITEEAWLAWEGSPARAASLKFGPGLPDLADIAAAKFDTSAWTGPGERMLAASLFEMGLLAGLGETKPENLAAFLTAWAGANPDHINASSMAICMIGCGGDTADERALAAAGDRLIAALKLLLVSYGAAAAAKVGVRVGKLRALGMEVEGSVIGTIAAEVMAAQGAGAGSFSPRTAPPGTSSLELVGEEGGVEEVGGGDRGTNGAQGAGVRMSCLRPRGHEDDSCQAVIGHLAAAEGIGEIQVIGFMGKLCGAPLGCTESYFGFGVTACNQAGVDFDAALERCSMVFEHPPRDWAEAGGRLMAVGRCPQRIEQLAGGAGTGVAASGGSSPAAATPAITHAPQRGSTTRTKAAGAGSTRSAAHMIVAPLAREAIIEAEHLAIPGVTPTTEARRLTNATYGAACAAFLLSDGTISGSLGEKGRHAS
jgi:hypothetical protein